MENSVKFVPYGPEWERELMKFRKPMLVDLIRKAYMKEYYQENLRLRGALDAMTANRNNRDAKVRELEDQVKSLTYDLFHAIAESKS